MWTRLKESELFLVAVVVFSEESDESSEESYLQYMYKQLQKNTRKIMIPILTQIKSSVPSRAILGFTLSIPK